MTLVLFAVALPGCGSSDEATTGTPAVNGGGTAAAPKPPASEAGMQGKAKPEQKGKATSRTDSGQPNQEKAKTPEERGNSQQASRHRIGAKGSVCPTGMSNGECKQRIEAATGGAQTPGKEASPSNCTDVMTKEQCEEILAAQKAAEKQGGSSVSPETCLQEYSREFCEERFGEQAEQQAGQ